MFRLEYASKRSTTAIGDMSTIHRAIYCKPGANIAHTFRFTLYELWSRTYTMHFQLHIYRLQYSIERICADIGDNRTLRCPLYCKFGAKYSPHHPVYPMWTVFPDIYNVITPRVFRLQYSNENIGAAIADIWIIKCALYCTICAKYTTHDSVYAMWTVVPDIYKVFTPPHSQATIFNWTRLRSY
jgi:hypothetical protein